MMTHYNNGLNRLLELLQRQSQTSNNLLLRLITRCANEIRPDDKELLHHVFIEPARDTCTFTILFNDSFAKLPIRKEILDRLTAIWTIWEGQQLKYEEIWRKKNYTADQKFYFDKIWETVGKYCGKQYQIAVLFETAHKDMMEKTRIKEKMTTCLNDYCHQAIDKEIYFDYLSMMQYHMEHSVINEIRVPPELKELIPFVERLIPFTRSNAWLQFYANHVQEQSKVSTVNHEDNQDEHWNDLCGIDDTDEHLG
jgi:hypothetical protein